MRRWPTALCTSRAPVLIADAYFYVFRAAEHGIEIAPGCVTINFATIMERMRRIRAEISKNDSAERCAAQGVDVFLGRGVFDSPNTISVNGQRLTFRRVSTGNCGLVICCSVLLPLVDIRMFLTFLD